MNDDATDDDVLGDDGNFFDLADDGMYPEGGEEDV